MTREFKLSFTSPSMRYRCLLILIQGSGHESTSDAQGAGSAEISGAEAVDKVVEIVAGWLKYVRHDSALMARSNRVLCGHAPMGEYR